MYNPTKKAKSSDNVQKEGHINNKLQLQNDSSTFFLKNKSLLPATSNLSCSPMAHNITASLDKLSCTNYLDFGERQDTYLDNFFSPKVIPTSWMSNSKFSRKLTTKISEWLKSNNGRGRSQPVHTIEKSACYSGKNFGREENLSPTMSEDMKEQLKLAQKDVDVVDRANKKIFVTLLQYNVDEPESSYVQVLVIARTQEDEKIQQNVYVK